MKIDWQRLLGRAREDLDAAAHLASAGFNSQAVSRAYFAAFLAAEAALGLIGESSSKHAGVISAFGRRIIKEGGLGPEVGETLRALFKLRGDADYRAAHFSPQESAQAIERARMVLDAIERWISLRDQAGG